MYSLLIYEFSLNVICEFVTDPFISLKEKFNHVVMTCLHPHDPHDVLWYLDCYF